MPVGRARRAEGLGGQGLVVVVDSSRCGDFNASMACYFIFLYIGRGV